MVMLRHGISVSNRVLYSDEIYYLDFIEDNLGLELHNITTLDLCLDLSCDVARMIRRLIRNKNVTTFLNTKEVKTVMKTVQKLLI